MNLPALFITLSLAQEPTEACPAPPPEASTADIRAHLLQHIRTAGQKVPACDQAIDDLEATICANPSPDLYSRADAHNGLRELAAAQGDTDAVNLHCCVELALRDRYAKAALDESGEDPETVQDRREANQMLLAEIPKSCPRSPICPADVLVAGYTLTCEGVAAALAPPKPAPPPTHAPIEPDERPELRVNTPMRRGGVTLLTLGALGVGTTVSALIVGAVANHKIAATAGDIRTRWDDTGRAMNSLAISAGVVSAVAVIVSIPLLVCSRPGGCGRTRRVAFYPTLNIPGFIFSGRF